MQSQFKRRAFQVLLLALAGSRFSHSQSLGCYPNAICTMKVQTCHCNGADFSTAGYQSWAPRSNNPSCNLSVGAACHGNSCSQHATSGHTDYPGYCIGPVIGNAKKQLSFNVDGQARQNELRQVAATLTFDRGVGKSECGATNKAFEAWLHRAMGSVK